MALAVKNPPVNAGDIRDLGSIPGSERSPGGGHSNRLQYLAWKTPWIEKPGGGVAIVHGLAQNTFTAWGSTPYQVALLEAGPCTEL